jgi:hypothetical protein
MRAALLGACLAFTSSGCNSINCGPGTYKNGDSCVNFDPNDHTPPTTTIAPGAERSRNVVPDPITLVANEPATVYYTIDGTDPDPATTPGHRDMATIRSIPSPTTIKFMSVDTAGNKEDVQSATFVQDLTPPAPVSGMSVTITGTTAHVAWTNPADADWAGTAIARVVDVVNGAPADGHLPVLNDAVTPSLQIVSIGQNTSFDDTGVKAGPARYVAWTYDDLGNYSIPASASALVPLGSLTATLVYNTTTQTLTISQAPAHIDIAATTASLNGTNLTVMLAATNQSLAYLYNPKVEITSVTGASLASSDGTADTFPYKSLGANAFAPGAAVTSSLQFTTSATTVTINLVFVSHASLVASHGGSGNQGGIQLFDLGTGNGTIVFPFVSLGTGGRVGGRPHRPAFVGGHFLDVPTTHGVIERFDLATGKAAGVAALTTTIDGANIQGMVAVGGGEVAVVKLASKGRARYSQIRTGLLSLVRLDEGLHILKTVSYPFTDSTGSCQPVASPDGNTLALASDNAIALVDMNTLAVIDADPGTTDLDTFTPASMGRVGSIVWLNNSDLLVVTRRTGQAAVVHRTGNTYTTSIVYNDHTLTQGGFAAAAATDGKVWMSFPTTIQVYDPVAGTVAPLSNYSGSTQGVVRVGTDMWIVHGDHMGLDRVANDGTISGTITIPTISPNVFVCSPSCNGVYGHWLQLVQ